jgi:hypothetical protein
MCNYTYFLSIVRAVEQTKIAQIMNMTLFDSEPPKKSNLDERREEFINLVIRQAEPMGMPVEMMEEFIEYWTEHNDGGHKMRFEKEKTWNTNGRLRRWMKNDTKFNRNKPKSDDAGSVQSQADIIARRFGNAGG